MSFTPRVLAARLIAVAAAVAAVAGINPAAASASAVDRPALPKPAIAGPGLAPIGGVVPGRTGSDITSPAGLQTIHRNIALARAKPALAAAQEHPAAGTYFSGLTTSTGVRATHTVFYGTGDRTIPSDVLYAPTLMPPSNACIEITTAYTSGTPVVWAWDWCRSSGSGVAKEIAINAGFVSTYTTQVNGLPAYSVDISKTNTSNNTWTAYLYNFRNSTWDVFWTRSGTSQIGADGWDVFEPYVTRNPSTGIGYYCATMAGRKFEARGIQVRINGTWTNAASSNRAFLYRMDLACGSRLTWTQPNLYSWSASIT